MLSFFPVDVLDEIWDLIESVSEGFVTYSRWVGLAYRQVQFLPQDYKRLRLPDRFRYLCI